MLFDYLVTGQVCSGRFTTSTDSFSDPRIACIKKAVVKVKDRQRCAGTAVGRRGVDQDMSVFAERCRIVGLVPHSSMRTGLVVQEIRGRTGNQEQARIDMPLRFRHFVAWIGKHNAVDVELIFIQVRLEGAQRSGPEVVRLFCHIGDRGPLAFVDTALNANNDFDGVGLWSQQPERDAPVR